MGKLSFQLKSGVWEESADVRRVQRCFAACGWSPGDPPEISLVSPYFHDWSIKFMLRSKKSHCLHFRINDGCCCTIDLPASQ